MIIVAGHLIVEPEQRDAYLENCRALTATARATAGCFDFQLSADLLDDSRINIFERWRGRYELDTFRGSGTDDEQNQQIRSADVREFIYDQEVRL